MQDSLETVVVKLSDLVPDPENTRIHDSHNIEVIKKSLEKFGQYRAFVVQKKGMIIRVGNGMYEAMKQLGWKQASCVIKDIDDEEAKALSIVDNKASDLSVFDNDRLSTVLSSMKKDSLNLTGFHGVELDKLIKTAPIEIPTDKPKKNKEPSKPSIEPMPIRQYQIIFENDEHFSSWIEFVRIIKEKYDGTIAGSLVSHAKEWLSANGHIVDAEIVDNDKPF